MMSDYLLYTDYEIVQDDKGFKVSTDTVALGLFLNMLYSKTVLDIGTNNGALLLYALKNKAKSLIGVDINKNALKYAKMNLSKYTDDYKLYYIDVRELEIERVDIILCNPPFFEMNNVTNNLDIKDALFEESLPLEDLFKTYKRLLKDNGEIYMIYDASRFINIYEMCLKYKYKIMKMQFVYDINSENALRVLLKLKIGKMKKFNIKKPLLLKAGKFIDLYESI